MKSVQFLVLSLSLIICAGNSAFAMDPGFNDKVIKFATMQPLSGPLAVDGRAVADAIRACFKRVNAAGGVQGRTLELVTFDDGYDPVKTKEGYDKLVKEGVFGFISNWGSQTTLAIVQNLEADKIPLVGPIAGTNFGVPVRKSIFVVRPNGSMESSFMVKHILKDLGKKSIGVVYQNDGLGKSILEGITKALEGTGEAIAISGKYSRNDGEIASVAASFVTKKPDIVVLGGAMPGTAAFVKKAAENKLNPIYFGPSSTVTEQFMKELGNTKYTFYGSSVVPVIADPNSALAKSYTADMKAGNFSDVDQHGVEAYLSAAVAVEALKMIKGTLSREAFISALETFKDTPVFEMKFTYSPTNHQGLTVPYLTKAVNGVFQPVEIMK